MAERREDCSERFPLYFSCKLVGLVEPNFCFMIQGKISSEEFLSLREIRGDWLR